MLALRALASLRRARAETWCWFGIYLLSAALVLEGLIALGRYLLPALRDLALDHVFPEAWHPFVADIATRLLSGQMAAIAASAGMGIGVFAVGVTLFPIKERLSASFEADAFPDMPRGEEPPLLVQGFEEVKLMGLYAVFQGLAVYLGLQGVRWLAVAGTALGYWYLALAMALDHAAPAFQRRGAGLGAIVWALRRAPVSLHLLGALFVLPAVALQPWASANLRPEEAIALVAGAEVVGMALAAMAGCALGAEVIRGGLDRGVPKLWSVATTAAALAVLAWQAAFFTWWGLAIDRRSQLLKCGYRVDWERASYEARGRPSPGGQVAVIRLSSPVAVTNPTARAIDLGGVAIEVHGAGGLLATAVLAAASAPPHATTEVLLDATFELPVEPLAGALPGLLGERFHIYVVVAPPLSAPVRIAVLEMAERGGQGAMRR